MKSDKLTIQETLNKYNIRVSMDDSIKSYIKKIKYGLSKIEDDSERELAIKDISYVMDNHKFITKRALL